jgi:hypothetical protein
MKPESDVKFIRVRGRIIPIRKKTATGAQEIAAGAATAYGGSVLAAKILKASEKRSQRSFDFGMDKTNKLPRFAKDPIQGMKQARFGLKASKVTLGAAGLIGGFGIAKGLKSIIKPEDTKTDLGIELVSYGAASQLKVGFARSFGLNPKMGIPRPVKAAGKELLARLLSKQLRFKL